MLVLSRRLGESILIGEDVTIRVLSVRDNQVKLGIDAPDEVLILREEVADRRRQSEKAVEEK